MSWDHQAYRWTSFGYSNARPLTPRKTPTTVGCTSAGFETPRNLGTSSSHSGLNPTFSEDYAGFSGENHFSADHDSGDKTQTTLSVGHGFYPSQPSAAELISPVENVSYDTSVSLPAVDNLRSMAETSQAQVTQHWEHGSQFEVTSQNQNYANSRTTSQVATPPGTESRGHSSKPSLNMMQDPFYTGMQLPQPPPFDLSAFSTSNGDVCGFSFSAPGTANMSSVSADNFWALDTSMSGMNMNFENSNADFMGLPNKRDHSFDWGSNNQTAQNEATMSFSYEVPPSQPAFDFSKNFRRASIATTEPLGISLDTNVPDIQDPFVSATSNSSLDTEPLFGLPTTSSMDLQYPLSTFVASAPPKQHPFYPPPKQDSQNVQKAYAHSRPTSAASSKSRKEKSPVAVAKIRPGMTRSITESRGLGNAYRSGQSTIKSFPESRSRTTSDQASPSNERPHSNLFPIPEITSKKRNPSIIFTIDANGRARTETSYTSTEQRTKPGGPSRSKDDWPSSDADSPSDEDLVLKPGRRASLQKSDITNGGAIITLPKRSHSSSRSRSDGGFSRASFTSKEYHQRESGRGAEAVHADDDDDDNDNDSTGDATSALRKVMKIRQNRKTRPDQQKYVSDSRAPLLLAQHQHRRTSALNRVSPSQSTSPKGPTRCICDNLETDGLFLIQCESCANWLHGNCVKINERNIPVVYICAFCAQTPLGVRISRMRDSKSGSGDNTTSSMAQNEVERI